jgi:hypothetical protein
VKAYRKHAVIPDTQVRPGVKLDHLEWIGNYLAEKKPDVIVQIGDFADMHSLSSWDKGKKSAENARYSADVQVARDAMRRLTEPIRKEVRATRGRWRPRLILTLGNHEDRITRFVDSNPELDGKLSIDDLGYADAGFEVHDFLRPVVVDGIAYAHYFTSGPMGRPVPNAKAMVKKYHQSCTMGHVQATDWYPQDTHADGRPILGLFAGTCYLHDEPYLGPQGNFQRRQIVLKHEVSRGVYDPMFVSLNYLERKYA